MFNRSWRSNLLVFACLWLIVFVLYLPAAKAGWVSDTVEWWHTIQTKSFTDYVNWTQTRGSLYQFTQVVTYFFFRLFGAHRWLWHLLFVTLQAANATLIFAVIQKLLEQTGVRRSNAIAAAGVVLFCVNPHISEVLVWKASFHYLQGLLLLMSIVFLAQQFQDLRRPLYPFAASVIYLLSSFTLEYFYLTPWFVVSLAIYYRRVLGYDREVFKRTILYFVVPEVVIFVGHLVLLRTVAGSYTGTLVDEVHQPLISYLRKPPIYVYHILFFGRFFSFEGRHHVYDFLSSVKMLAVFYGVIVLAFGFLLARFKSLSPALRASLLTFAWLVMATAIACPLWLADTQLVAYDRYAYLLLPFLYILIAILLFSVNIRGLAMAVVAGYVLVNIYFTHKVNKYWGESSHIVQSLMQPLPPADDKIILLVNLPENMNGIPMIGPLQHSPYKLMYELNNRRELPNTVYDVLSYNMVSAGDGAHVMVVNDSVIHVTLNQWGTWWWYGNMGAFSYENSDYKLNLVDGGHWYELTLKHPSSQYLALFQVGDKLKAVNWQTKGVDQY